jgi:uncharacterized protein YrrD
MGKKLHTVDGDMGHIDDFYFGDDDWIVRYMIVRTGSWFSHKDVMLALDTIPDLTWDVESLRVELTQDQIKNAPDLDLAKPVTREQEMELAQHYQWPDYGSTAPGNVLDVTTAGVVSASVPDTVPGYSETTKAGTELRRAAQAGDLPHLRGIKEVTGYHIAETDGEIGHVSDFFFDENSREIQYLLVDTGHWLPGRKVLIATKWIDDISWAEKKVYVTVTREQVKNSPEFDPRGSVERHYEESLHDHYGLPPYWL